MALFFIFPEPLSEIFFHEAEAIQISVSYFLIIGISEAFMSVELMTIGCTVRSWKNQTVQHHQYLIYWIQNPICNGTCGYTAGTGWNLVGNVSDFSGQRHHLYDSISQDYT